MPVLVLDGGPKKTYRFDLAPVLGFAFLSNPWAILFNFFSCKLGYIRKECRVE